MRRTHRPSTPASLRTRAGATGLLLLATTAVSGVAVAPAGAATSTPPVPVFAQTSAQAVYAPAPSYGTAAFSGVDDLDGDGDQDVVTAIPFVGLAVELGRGDGTFAPPVRLVYAQQPNALGIGDLDEDGYPEVIAKSATSQVLAVFHGSSSGPVGPPQLVPVAGGFSNYSGPLVSDLDLDGHLDVAVQHGSSTFVVLKGDGAGGLVQTTVMIPLPSNAFGIATPDLNGDGYPDVVSTNTVQNLTVSLSTGTGAFGFLPPTTVPVSTFVHTFDVADIDSDGDLDVVWGVNGTAGAPAQGLFVLRGLGGGLFAPAPEKLFVGRFGGAAVADVNRDGLLDISTHDVSTARVISFLGAPGGGYVQALQSAHSGGLVAQVLAADFDGDGDPDLHVASASTATSYVHTYQANLDSPAISTQPQDAAVVAGTGAVLTAAASGYPVPTVQWQRSTNSGGAWTNVAGATAVTYTTPPVTAGTVGYWYRAVFTNSTGTATTTHATLSLVVAPSVSTEPADGPVTSGQPASFTAGAAGSASSVQWQSSDDGTTFVDVDGATSPTLTVTPSYADGGRLYRAVFTNAAGSATTRSALLTVAAAAPVVSQDPADQEVGSGGTATFVTAATGDPAPSVQWQLSTDGGGTFTDLDGETSATLVVTPSYAADGDEVRAVFTNPGGSTTTAPALLTVQSSAPATTLDPQDATADPGDDVTFSAAATGDPEPTVRWQVSTDDGVTFDDVPGATGTDLVVEDVDRADDGTYYWAVFTNPGGETTSHAASLTVRAEAPVVTQDPMDRTVESGAEATFTAAASGDPEPTVRWQVSTDDGLSFVDLAGEVGTTLTVATADGDDQNRYRAVFTNPGGEVATAAAVLTVSVDPVVVPSAPLDVVVTQTGPGQITITWSEPADAGTSPVSGYAVGYGTSGWGNGEEVSATTFGAVFEDLPEGDYTAVVTALSEAGEGERATLAFTVGPFSRPIIPVPATTAPAPPVPSLVQGVVVRPGAVRDERGSRDRDEELARTGLEAGDALGLASCGFVLGGLLLLVSRRRRAGGRPA